MKGADSATSSLFSERDGNDKVEEKGKIYLLSGFVYICIYIQEGNVYLHQPNVTFKQTK